MLCNVHSYYSLRYGVFSEVEALKLCERNGFTSMALTDINNTSGCLNFLRCAQKTDIHPVVGIEFRNDMQLLYIGIAKNNEGYRALNDFLSEYSHEQKDFPLRAPRLKAVFWIYPYHRKQSAALLPLNNYEFIGVAPKDVKQLDWGPTIPKQQLLAWKPISFRGKKDYNTHRLLRAIDQNVLLSKLAANQQAQQDEFFPTKEQMEGWYAEVPYLLGQTQSLLQSCNVTFKFEKERESQNLKSYTGDDKKDLALLQQLCKERMPYRYPNPTPAIHERVKKELDLIVKMGFVAFFLINWDIVSYAQRRGFFHVGRGSGANSIVAYLLGITDVDPVALDLYFERFMNLYRANPPDFDIDFSWRDRQEVTEYIFNRFPNTALLATYNTFQFSGAIREIGKVLGLPKEEIDRLSNGKFDIQSLDDLSKLVVRYSEYIHGLPNHLSIHAGGIIISDQPIHTFSATFLPPKGFPTVQFDMVIAEDVGLYKFDILGQRGLAKIKDAMELVKRNHPEKVKDIDIHQVDQFIQDPKINQLVADADCIGCFYVESPAMRMLLRKLGVNNYLGLVAASSIIRPGVARSGMMKEYILRHKDPDRRKEAHPIMDDIMPDTYGIMVYQEDVIKVAHYFAGLDLGEADALRRGMSGKFRSREEFQKVQNSFFEKCRQKGHSDQLTQTVWHQIESFAGYAFAKGHSASYAIESYQCLYLKTYFPLEYMVAVVNNGGGFYSVESYLHETRLKGGKVEAPCLNTSEIQTVLKDQVIFLGFQHIQGFSLQLSADLVEERLLHGAYKDLQDLLSRLTIGLEQLDKLIRIGAFRFTGKDKRTLLWEAHFFWQKMQRKTRQSELFIQPQQEIHVPQLRRSYLEDRFDEIELLGFTLGSPFELMEDSVHDGILSGDLSKYLNQEVQTYGYLVTAKGTKTVKGERMYFGTFIDVSGDWIDTVHFPPVVRKFPFRGKGIYRIRGKVTKEFDFYSIETTFMEKMPYIPDPRYNTDDSVKAIVA